MTRRAFYFLCEGSQCAATLDLPPATIEHRSTGLLIVTGGNELRGGPYGSQASLAAHFAALGHPVLRYDRRGVGDSEGENHGWRGAKADVLAAAQAFREACPQLSQIVGYGNCDGASSLLQYGERGGLSHLILANPWAYDHDGETAKQPAASQPEHNRASILRYYRARLANPLTLLRDVIAGNVQWRNAVKNAAALSTVAEATQTALALSLSLEKWRECATLLLARDDRTALHFIEQMALQNYSLKLANTFPTASHSFADDAAQQWLFAQIEAVLTAP